MDRVASCPIKRDHDLLFEVFCLIPLFARIEMKDEIDERLLGRRTGEQLLKIWSRIPLRSERLGFDAPHGSKDHACFRVAEDPRRYASADVLMPVSVTDERQEHPIARRGRGQRLSFEILARHAFAEAGDRHSDM